VRSGRRRRRGRRFVAALVPKAELEGEMATPTWGCRPPDVQALRKLTAIVARSKTCFIFINQIREKIGFFLAIPRRRRADGPSNSTLPCASTSGV